LSAADAAAARGAKRNSASAAHPRKYTLPARP